MATEQAQLEQIAKKSGLPLEEVKQAYQSALSSLPVNIPATKRPRRALQIINADLVGGGKSPAVSYHIVIVGAGQARDLNATKRQQALEAFNSNATDAETRGLIRKEGDQVIVLDNLKTFKNGNDNPNYGKALQEAWQRTLIVAAKKPSDESFVGSTLQLRGDIAKGDLPLNKFISTRLLGDLKDGLRSSPSATTLKVDRDIPGDELQLITEQAFESKMKTLSESFDYVKSLPEGKPEFYDRYVVTEASVGMIKKSTDPNKNHFMLVNDISTDRPVSCFVPFNLGNMLNIGRKSLLTLVAQPNIGKGWDNEAKAQTDEDVLQLNILGIQHVPSMIKPPEESG